MKKSPLLILSVLLAACGPDKLISDLPSPNGQYHVEVRKCPEKGSITWGEEIQVSLLETGKSEKCCGFHADSDTHSTRIRTVIPR